MSPILDGDGNYTDVGKGAHPVFQNQESDPASLPQVRPDRYARWKFGTSRRQRR
jgi:hypothetical protein